MTNKLVKLSISLATYNRLEYLKLTINHLFKEIQHLTSSYEINIIDGGSDDGTVEFVKSISEINLFKGGLSDSCKIYKDLFYKSSGDYILMMTDKQLINLKEINKACKIMDNEPDFGELFCMFSAVKSKEPFKVPGYKTKTGIVFGDLCLFRRNDALKYWDTNYSRGGCNTDFHLRLLLAGKFVAFSKGITSYELKFRHYDRLQFLYKWRKSNFIEGDDYLNKKYKIIFDILNTNLSKNKLIKFRILIFRMLFDLFRKFILSVNFDNKFWKVFKYFNKTYSMPNYPYIPKEDLPPEFGRGLPGLYPDDAATLYKRFLKPSMIHNKKIYEDVEEYLRLNHEFLKHISKKKEWESYFVEQKLDQRVNFPYVKEIYEWLLFGTSAYKVKNHKYAKDLHLIQKLPESIVKLVESELEILN